MTVPSPERKRAGDGPNAPAFQQAQYQFAAHIRQPAKNPRPADVEERRMKIYRELFYNNIEGFLQGNFPVLHRLSSDEYWHSLVRDFFATHRCQSPYFLEIGQEFIAYLVQEREPQPQDPPFLAELAHYEWVELALETAEQAPDWTQIEPDGDLLAGHPVQSPLAWSLAYQYPVHRIGEQFQPDQPGEQPTYLLAYRNDDFDVKFMAINAVTARLLYLLAESPQLSGRAAMQQIAGELNHPQPEIVIDGGLQTLKQLRAVGVLLGTARN
ncbi:HvfC family RiPP maturation protein [Marinobacterium arenosum]|uniref:HvfC family RiPP maturation protein n=1 Tax=Marinobacterium arenosum TaxID=2862496 RepID=UPI001C939AE4|nr:putative DNA-binding domain-containing protein [Marinobacterium arenosum]MBY4678540.1 putative DNA-binding domain-containing protein [Marinobacterium arenosum]